MIIFKKELIKIFKYLSFITFILINSICVGCKYNEYKGFSKIVDINPIIKNENIYIEMYTTDSERFSFHIINEGNTEIILQKFNFQQIFRNIELTDKITEGFYEKDSREFNLPHSIPAGQVLWIRLNRKINIVPKIGDIYKVSYNFEYKIKDVVYEVKDSFKMIYHVQYKEILTL